MLLLQTVQRAWTQKIKAGGNDLKSPNVDRQSSWVIQCYRYFIYTARNWSAATTISKELRNGWKYLNTIWWKYLGTLFPPSLTHIATYFRWNSIWLHPRFWFSLVKKPHTCTRNGLTYQVEILQVNKMAILTPFFQVQDWGGIHENNKK